MSKTVPGTITHDWTIVAGSLTEGTNEGRLLVGVGVASQGTKDTKIATPGTLNDDRWHHVVWTRSQIGRNRLYIDGQPVADAHDGGGPINNSMDIFIGADNRPWDMNGGKPANCSFFHGQIAEVAVYDHELDLRAIREHFRHLHRD